MAIIHETCTVHSPNDFRASDCGELCILHQMITCRLSGCQRLEGDLPEPRRRVGVERVRGDAATGAWLAWSCLVAVFEVAAADPLEQRCGREQHRCRGSLLWGLPVETAI